MERKSDDVVGDNYVSEIIIKIQVRQGERTAEKERKSLYRRVARACGIGTARASFFRD